MIEGNILINLINLINYRLWLKSIKLILSNEIVTRSEVQILKSKY